MFVAVVVIYFPEVFGINIFLAFKGLNGVLDNRDKDRGVVGVVMSSAFSVATN